MFSFSVCVFDQPITSFAGVTDFREEEQEDELDKCRRHAAYNFPVSGM